MKEKILKKIRKFFLSMIIFALFFELKEIKTEYDPDEDPNYYVHFDMSDPDIVIIDKDNSNPEIKDIITKSTSIKIPNVELDKEGYFFSGWTEDGIYGYEKNDVFNMKSKNTTFKPVFGLLSDKRTFTLEYIVEYEGEIIKTSLNKGHYSKNRIVATVLNSFPQDKANQRGWTDGKNSFVQGQKLVMPENNVTLYAIFHYYRNLTYVPGDVDGIVGQQYDIQTLHEGGKKDLAESSRLSRMGYTIIAWHCENDGIDYPIFYQYIMPDEDVIMTAVWEPLTYVVVFNTQVNSIPNIKIRGKTKEKLIAPDLENEREGYTFIGWKLYDTEIYYPGDEIVIKGQMPGFGISGKAIWISNTN